LFAVRKTSSSKNKQKLLQNEMVNIDSRILTILFFATKTDNNPIMSQLSVMSVLCVTKSSNKSTAKLLQCPQKLPTVKCQLQKVYVQI